MNLTQLTITILIIIGLNAFGQNKHLSFTDGSLSSKTESTLPQIHVKNNQTSGIELSYKFNGAMVAEKEVEKVLYQFLHIEGFFKTGQVGAPALPTHKEVIALPVGAEAEIQIINAEYIEVDGYMIHPSLQPAKDVEGAPEPQFEKDLQIYSSNSFFPVKQVEQVGLGISRSTPLLYIEVRPVQFNPVTGKLRLYSNISFKINFKGGSGSFENIGIENSKHYTDLLKRRVINSESVPDGSTSKSEFDPNYLIVTHSAYEEQAEQLAQWKRQLGYNVEIISKSSWDTYSVKEAIHARYENYTPKPDYFVIIGDHTGEYPVPGEIHQPPGEPDDFATDVYYACMDGDYDWHPDMAYGRISVQTVEEAQVVIDKVINYEKNPPESEMYYSNLLNCAQYQDDDNDGYADRRFTHTSEDIRAYLQNEHGYTSNRVYMTESTADVTTLRYNNGYYSTGELLTEDLRTEDFNWLGSSGDIRDNIDAGRFIVFHRDHGYVGGSGWAHPYFVTGSMDALENGELLPVVFSINCHTGEYQLNNCFAEKFMRLENKGAVGVFAAAYYSMSGYNDALSIGMIDAIWSTPGVYPDFGYVGSNANYTIGPGNDLYTMGDVLVQGLYAMEQNISSNSYFRYTYELFHYFGDPAMRLWTANPHDSIISANHPESLDCESSEFVITDSEPFALATLLLGDKIYGGTTLDENGNGTIDYDLNVLENDAILTISKHNCKPYVYDLQISGECLYPPVINLMEVSDITDTEVVFSSAVETNGGANVLESGFVYSTYFNPVNGSDATFVSTNSPVDEGAFEVQVAGLTPNTIYFVQSYAYNNIDTAFGQTVEFSTDCSSIGDLPYNCTFSDVLTPDCWFVIDSIGKNQVWEFNNLGDIDLNSTTASNGFASLNSGYFGNGEEQNSNLISPNFDLTDAQMVVISFEHWFRQYPNSIASLSYSIDGRNTWNTIQEWEMTTPNVQLYEKDITDLVAGYEMVSFKWNYKGSNAWFWAVDDVEVRIDDGPRHQIQFNIYQNGSEGPVAGAMVNINNETVTTSGAGNAYVYLEDGTYDYSIFANGYGTIDGFELTVNGAWDTVNVDLSHIGISAADQNDVAIYPNPTSGVVNIRGNEDYTLKVYTPDGKLLISQNINKTGTIDLFDMNSGIYFIYLKSNNTLNIRKILLY